MVGQLAGGIAHDFNNMLGIMIASYGNAALGTMPTGMLIYTAMALMLNAPFLDSQMQPAKEPEV